MLTVHRIATKAANRQKTDELANELVEFRDSSPVFYASKLKIIEHLLSDI